MPRAPCPCQRRAARGTEHSALGTHPPELLLRYFRTGTDVVEVALDALWLAGNADGAAVVDDPVGEGGPFLLWQELHQVLLDHHRVAAGGEAEAGGDAGDVGVDDDADRLLEGVRQ